MNNKIFYILVCFSMLLSCKKNLQEKPIDVDSKTGATVRVETKVYSVKDISIDTFSDDKPITVVVKESPKDAKYRFRVVGNKLLFISSTSGNYFIELKQEDKSQRIILYIKPDDKLSEYIYNVYDYKPAPGQWVNDLPKYEDGDNQEDMNMKAKASIVGDNPSLISLGGWGGYVVFGFDHSIINVEGKADFSIYGNSYSSGINSDPRFDIGSSEPGIVMVSYDANNNGKPDDEWYEILGSGSLSIEKEPWYKFFKSRDDTDLNIYRDYSITYYKPTNNTDVYNYIKWTDNKGNTSYIPRNSYHSQPYYPQWIDKDKLVFKGVRLANNTFNSGGIYTQALYSYGYVDNIQNNDIRNAIDIDWAIDSMGNKVNLIAIDFIKVYNGVNSINGAIGESSPEIMKGIDLHMFNKDINTSDIVKHN